MKKDLVRKYEREKGELNLHQLPSTKRHVIVAPTVTRRPKLDAMLGHMTVIAEYLLEGWAQKAMNFGEFTKQELDQYTNICQTVIRQTRTEMEVEKHVEARAKTESDRDLAISITERLMDEFNLENRVIEAILEELGLEL